MTGLYMSTPLPFTGPDAQEAGLTARLGPELLAHLRQEKVDLGGRWRQVQGLEVPISQPGFVYSLAASMGSGIARASKFLG
jgi:hypothetical protein